MKILVLGENLFKGGVTPAMLNLLTKFAHKEIDFDLLLLNNLIEWEVPKEVKDKITVLNQKTPQGKVQKLFRLFTDSYRIFWKSRNYDVVLLNGDLFQLTIPAFLSKMIWNKKIIFWVHICLSEVTYYPNIIFKLIHAYTLRYGSAYAFCSYRSVDSFYRYTGLNKTTLHNYFVIYNILTANKMVTKELKHKFLHKDALHLVALGRLVWEKNFSLLINAMSIVRDKYKIDCELIICGEGDEFDSLHREILELNLSDSVQLVGVVDEPYLYIAQSDVLISSSYDTESLPMVVGEALMCNKPVISTRTGAAEILEYGKYGLVVDINDKEQLAEAIYKMSDLKLREYYAMLSPEALIRFSTDKIIDQWGQLFAAILGTQL